MPPSASATPPTQTVQRVPSVSSKPGLAAGRGGCGGSAVGGALGPGRVFRRRRGGGFDGWRRCGRKRRGNGRWGGAREAQLRFDDRQPPFERVRPPLEAKRHEEAGDGAHGNGDRHKDEKSDLHDTSPRRPRPIGPKISQ